MAGTISTQSVYDVAVIGAGPAGAQAAISAAHQTRHVLVIDAGPVSHLKGRAFWSKSVEIQDAPVFTGVLGSHFMRSLREWMASRPVETVAIGGRTKQAGIDYKPGYVLKLNRLGSDTTIFKLDTSQEPLRKGRMPGRTRYLARTVIVASGFDDVWPDIEVNAQADRLYQRYQTVFRFAGNRRGWHVCIRCDGHLHIDEHLAILAVGDTAFDTTRGGARLHRENDHPDKRSSPWDRRRGAQDLAGAGCGYCREEDHGSHRAQNRPARVQVC